MRKIIFIGICLWVSLAGFAQDNKKFSPEKFEADQQDFITKEAKLDEREAAKFFPLLREMQKKQRALYNQMMAESKIKPADEKACKKVIQKRDQVELELKSIQQTYHNKFLSVLPASKVFDVIKAEDQYHRGLFRNWGRNPMANPMGGNPMGNPMARPRIQQGNRK